MYIFVFVFMLMGVLGLYTQVYTLQAAKMFSRQTAIAQTMLLYHNTSYAFARANNTGVATLSSTYCYQTYGVSVSKCAWGTLQIGAGQTNLPVGFNAATYAFPSVVYEMGGVRYLLTYVSPPTANAVNDMPNTPPIGFSVAHLFQQMKNTGVSPLLYGRISANVFTTNMIAQNPSSAATYSITYPVLSSIGLVDGTVGFLSPL